MGLIIPTLDILVLDGARAGPAQSEPSDGLKAAQHEVEQLVVVTLSAHVLLDHREGVVNDGHEHVSQHEHHDQDEAEEEDGRQHGLHGGELLVVERPQGERQERLEGRQEGAVGREPPPEHQQGELGVGADDDDEDDREGGHVLGRVAQGGRQHGDAPVKAQDEDEFDGQEEDDEADQVGQHLRPQGQALEVVVSPCNTMRGTKDHLTGNM